MRSSEVVIYIKVQKPACNKNKQNLRSSRAGQSITMEFSFNWQNLISTIPLSACADPNKVPRTLLEVTSQGLYNYVTTPESVLLALGFQIHTFHLQLALSVSLQMDMVWNSLTVRHVPFIIMLCVNFGTSVGWRVAFHSTSRLGVTKLQGPPSYQLQTCKLYSLNIFTQL